MFFIFIMHAFHHKTSTFTEGGWHDHKVIFDDPKSAKHPMWQYLDSKWGWRVMNVMKTQCLKWGEYKLDEYLQSKILDSYEEIEGILYAHGMGVSCIEIFPY